MRLCIKQTLNRLFGGKSSYMPGRQELPEGLREGAIPTVRDDMPGLAGFRGGGLDIHFFADEMPATPLKEVRKSLDAQPFQMVKTRIQASRRLAGDLRQRPHAPGAKALAEYLADRRSQGEPPIRVDARGYETQQMKVVYHTSDGRESVSEELVFFQKPGENGQPELLEVDGEPLLLNKDLYDAHYPAAYRTELMESAWSYVPTVGHRGQIVGIVALHRKQDTEALEK